MAYGLLRDTGFETGGQSQHIEMTANEHRAAQAMFALFPRLLQFALKDHVHGLKHQTLVFTFDIQNALGAQDVLPLFRQQLVEPAGELHPVDRLFRRQRYRTDFIVVDRVQVAMPVIMMPVIMMIVTTVLVMDMPRFAMRRIVGVPVMVVVTMIMTVVMIVTMIMAAVVAAIRPMLMMVGHGFHLIEIEPVLVEQAFDLHPRTLGALD